MFLFLGVAPQLVGEAVQIDACELLTNPEDFHNRLVAVRGLVKDRTQEFWTVDCKLPNGKIASRPIALFEFPPDSGVNIPTQYRNDPEAKYNPNSISTFDKALRAQERAEGQVRAMVTLLGFPVVDEDYTSQMLERPSEKEDHPEEHLGELWYIMLDRQYPNRPYKVELLFVAIRDPVFLPVDE